MYDNLKEELLFKSNHREELIQLTVKKIEIDGKLQTVPNAVNEYVESILKVIETGKITDFKFPSPHVVDYDL